MITSVDKETALDLLRRGKKNLFMVKTAGLLEAYGTGLDFCKTFAQRNTLLCRYYQDGIITRWGELADIDMDELCAFIRNCRITRVLADPSVSLELYKRLGGTLEKDHIMCYDSGIMETDLSGLEQNHSLDEVFPIVKEAFPEINYQDWYADWSHRVRHGAADIYLLEKSACAAVMREQYGAMYVSFVAARSDRRDSGLASRLMRILGAKAGNEGAALLLTCTDKLLPFYLKCGFREIGGAGTLTL